MGCLGGCQYAEWGSCQSYRVVDVKQKQTPDLRRLLLSMYLLSNNVLIDACLAFLFELLHVVAQGIRKIVGKLPIALSSVAQQI